LEVRVEPYTLRQERPDNLASEQEFRENLELSWCKGVMFNVTAYHHNRVLAEYDAILWNREGILFIEYKDTLQAYQAMSAKRAQQISDHSRNIARGLRFKCYKMLLVVRGIPDRTSKGGVEVLPLDRLRGYRPDFRTTRVELEYLEKLIKKHKEGEVYRQLEILRGMMEQHDG